MEITNTGLPGKESHAFYKEALELLNQSKIPFLLGGGFAFSHYTRIYRDSKDLDVFCKPADCPRILKYFADNGYHTELTDARWLGKIFREEYYVDVIFDTPNSICTVDDIWFEHADSGEFAGTTVRLVPAEELIWCKIYVQNRDRYDAADVNHIILKYGRNLNWERIMNRMDRHWHLLLMQILSFQFVYPADYRDVIPFWLFDDLMTRARQQYELPVSLEHVCRGPIIDQAQYDVDIKEWNYKALTMRTI